jgi:hypothetical protein
MVAATSRAPISGMSVGISESAQTRSVSRSVCNEEKAIFPQVNLTFAENVQLGQD